MKKWLLVPVSILISLMLFEAALQVLAIGRDILRGRRIGQLSENPRLGYEFKPGWTGGRVRINSLGFRGPETPVAKPPGRYRIVVLGDSLPFGVTHDEERIFPSLLQSGLKALAGPGREIEVVNAAVGGYNVTQYDELYLSRIRRLQPDFVVVSLCQNDFTPSGPYRLAWGGIVRGDFDEGKARAFPGNLFLVRKAQALAARLARSGKARPTAEELRKRAPTFSSGWDFGSGSLEGLIADVQQDGVGLLALIFPYRFQLQGAETETDARVSALLSARQVAFIDFLEPFRRAGTELYLPRDELHFNAEGHRLIAEAIVRRLQREVAPQIGP